MDFLSLHPLETMWMFPQVRCDSHCSFFQCSMLETENSLTLSTNVLLLPINHLFFFFGWPICIVTVLTVLFIEKQTKWNLQTLTSCLYVLILLASLLHYSRPFAFSVLNFFSLPMVNRFDNSRLFILINWFWLFLLHLLPSPNYEETPAEFVIVKKRLPTSALSALFPLIYSLLISLKKYVQSTKLADYSYYAFYGIDKTQTVL